jgi:hypothetical protein
MKARGEAGWRVFRIRIRLWERLRRLHTPTGDGSLSTEATSRPLRRAAKGDAAKSDRLTVLVSRKVPGQLEQPPAKMIPPR